MAGRLSQLPIEIVFTVSPSARLSQLPVEVVYSVDPSARLSQLPVEVVYINSPNARLSQYMLEVLTSPSPQARLTQAMVEVLGQPSGTAQARLTQFMTEVLVHTKPVVTSLSSSTLHDGDTLTITGSQFLTPQGLGKVLFNLNPGTITSWDATSISVTVPTGVTTGALTVYDRDGYPSDGTAYTVPVEAHGYSFAVVC